MKLIYIKFLINERKKSCKWQLSNLNQRFWAKRKFRLIHLNHFIPEMELTTDANFAPN